MKDPDGWALICCLNHFKGKFSYDVMAPDKTSYGLYEPDIFKAIK